MPLRDPRRLRRVERFGSPYAEYKLPAMEEGEVLVLTVADHWPSLRRFEPLDWVQVANQSGAASITVSPNPESTVLCPNSVTTVIDRNWWYSLRIVALGAVEAGEITLTAHREQLDEDELARRRALG